MTPISIAILPPDRWEAFQKIRLASLANEPRYEKNHREEAQLGETFWRSNIKYGVFALAGDEPVGLVLYTIDPPDNAKVYGLYVDAAWRRQGIGGRLFERVLGLIAENEHVSRLTLNVDPSLHHAVCLYKRHGFAGAGDVRNGELPMEKRL